jgi:hypothetical protein
VGILAHRPRRRAGRSRPPPLARVPRTRIHAPPVGNVTALPLSPRGAQGGASALLVPCNFARRRSSPAPATRSSFTQPSVAEFRRQTLSPDEQQQRCVRFATLLLQEGLRQRALDTPLSDITAVLDCRLAACRLELGAQRRESWSPRFESARIPCVHEGSRTALGNAQAIFRGPRPTSGPFRPPIPGAGAGT